MYMGKKNKGQDPKNRTLVLIASLLMIACLGYYFADVPRNNDIRNAPSPVACTLEAKICPDGTSVGRVGPQCDFAPCPTDSVTPPAGDGSAY